tara:strand:+ start:13292 stop:13741 length:450 start_codon:yes stop_codon:yes gene_type:complete
MEENLRQKLWAYIRDNSPEVMFDLQEDYSVGKYLDKKVNGIASRLEQWKKEGLPPADIETRALLELTVDLRPSKFHYIREILQTEFEEAYLEMEGNGTLAYQLLNLIDACKEIFEAIGFSEKNKEGRRLKYAIIGTIARYLEKLGDEKK